MFFLDRSPPQKTFQASYYITLNSPSKEKHSIKNNSNQNHKHKHHHLLVSKPARPKHNRHRTKNQIHTQQTTKSHHTKKEYQQQNDTNTTVFLLPRKYGQRIHAIFLKIHRHLHQAYSSHGAYDPWRKIWCPKFGEEVGAVG